ncbi:hypothetical protein KP509_30G022600 [Ceratopteris richardii]|uniref:Uncharacterized protein n=1 Tax=Ceratopteris richardii TaxID=49495 RepID=A0A8T2R2P4_CERRI|nr:hypothetical protein KP509_30G022600 [Ceratopteris richardii]
MSSSYDKVKRAKLSFKGGLDPTKKIEKHKKKKNKQQKEAKLKEGEGEQQEVGDAEGSVELDTGIGHAPDGGKKTKFYEELFPVETKRFGYSSTKTLTREEALDIRVKQKADRYCK